MEQTYTVQQVAAMLGLSAWTLRRLERLGRIPEPPRDRLSGWRRYSETDVARVRQALDDLASARQEAR